MCPSTEATDAQRRFAADVLRKLLHRIDSENGKGHEPFLVSHAWTDGPMMYLVYTAPPSDRTWGLARDTRDSIIDPGPWPDLDEAVLYYYLLDFEENQPSASFRRPGEPDTIWWFGFPRDGLPERPSDIPEAYRHPPQTDNSPVKRDRDRDRPVVNEPRLYGNPL
jgi:hypothetical protein